MPMPPLRDIVNDTPADATDVEYNFNTIEQWIRNELLDRAGTVTPTGPVVLAADPTNPMEAATKQYVDDSFPIGATIEWPVDTVPLDMAEMWKIADGQILNVSEFTVLYARYGDRFNRPGDAFGGTQFRLPDFRQRVSVGYDPLVAPFNEIKFAELETLGTAHTVVPTHNHPIGVHAHPINHNHPAFNTGPISIAHGHGHTLAVSNGGLPYSVPVQQPTYALGQYIALPDNGTAGDGLYDGTTSTPVSGTVNTHQHLMSLGAGAAMAMSAGNTAIHGHGITGGVSNSNDTINPLIDIPDFTGTSGAPSANPTGDAGVSATNKNYPPFIVMNRIVKVK